MQHKVPAATLHVLFGDEVYAWFSRVFDATRGSVLLGRTLTKQFLFNGFHCVGSVSVLFHLSHSWGV